MDIHVLRELVVEMGEGLLRLDAAHLGSDLETTQLYTQVSIHKLREVHAATHPGARLVRRKTTATTAGAPPASASAEAELHL